MFIFSRSPASPLRPLTRAGSGIRKKPPPRLRKQARIIGIVLAGGRSSRMGRDKALLPLAGPHNTMLSRTVNLLQDVCGRAMVSGRQAPGYACIPDMAPHCGPVGGVATALDYCQGAACLVLSCDMPFLHKELLQKLIAARNTRPQGAHITAFRHVDTGKIESTVAIYEPECLPYFQICANEKLLKICRVVPPHHYHFLEYSEEDQQAFFNLNSPADYELACNMMDISG